MPTLGSFNPIVFIQERIKLTFEEDEITIGVVVGWFCLLSLCGVLFSIIFYFQHKKTRDKFLSDRLDASESNHSDDDFPGHSDNNYHDDEEKEHKHGHGSNSNSNSNDWLDKSLSMFKRNVHKSKPVADRDVENNAYSPSSNRDNHPPVVEESSGMINQNQNQIYKEPTKEQSNAWSRLQFTSGRQSAGSNHILGDLVNAKFAAATSSSSSRKDQASFEQPHMLYDVYDNGKNNNNINNSSSNSYNNNNQKYYNSPMRRPTSSHSPAAYLPNSSNSNSNSKLSDSRERLENSVEMTRIADNQYQPSTSTW